mgnify:FL=1
MLVDNIALTIKAGAGGNGAATFLQDGMTAKGGPDGGDGGRGGDIYFQGSTDITDLRQFRFQKELRAEDGVNGKRKNLTGRMGKDITISLPLGTRITDLETGKIFEIVNKDVTYCFAHGGKGGRGNEALKTSTNQTPKIAEMGEEGERKKLFLELHLIAEIGLIGLPNAGKSSLLTVLTNATPLIGSYPFTTLEPNIGMLEKHPIADIPGLIEGASKGKGLGITFLKHIEKTKILVHCVALTDTDPQKSYDTIRSEFNTFNPVLLTKPEVIILTKTDLVNPEVIKQYTRQFSTKGRTVLCCSIYNEEEITAVKIVLKSLVNQAN